MIFNSFLCFLCFVFVSCFVHACFFLFVLSFLFFVVVLFSFFIFMFFICFYFFIFQIINHNVWRAVANYKSPLVGPSQIINHPWWAVLLRKRQSPLIYWSGSPHQSQ